MVQYSYSQIPNAGYRWNMFQNIERFVGVRPTGFNDSAGQTIIYFASALTGPQETALNSLMAGDPTVVPAKVGTRAVIKDIWEKRLAYKTSIGGFDFWIYYRESSPGSGVFDEIIVDFLQTLNVSQKKDMRDRYTDLMTEEV